MKTKRYCIKLWREGEEFTDIKTDESKIISEEDYQKALSFKELGQK